MNTIGSVIEASARLPAAPPERVQPDDALRQRDIPQWFVAIIGAGVGRLFTVRFQYGSPASNPSDAVATTETWIVTLWAARPWDQCRDEPRIRTAFLQLRLGTRWPVPRDFLDALPPIPRPKQAPKITSPTAEATARRYIGEIAALLGAGLAQSAEATRLARESNAARAAQLSAERCKLETELAAARRARTTASGGGQPALPTIPGE